MKKKIMAVCLAAALLTGAVPATYAAVPEEFKTLGSTIIKNDKVTVPTDIKLKEKDSAEYINGPLSLYVDDASKTSFDFRADIAMKNVSDKMKEYEESAKASLTLLGKTEEEIQEAIDSCYVSKGQFKITITLPNSTNFAIPDTFLTSGMNGFNSENGRHAEIFEETAARVKDGNKIIITVDVKGGKELTLKKLKEAVSDLWLICEGVTVDATGTYTIKGEIEGYTTIVSESDELGDLTYEFVQGTDNGMAKDPENAANEISGTIVVNRRGGGGHGLTGGGNATVTKDKTVTIVIADGIDNKTQSFPSGSVIDVAAQITVPTRPGYKFLGFYKDAALTQPIDGEIALNDNMTIYTKWEEDKTDVPNPPLDTAEHFAYVIGYPTADGSDIVRPEANITREEIATIFYRLLTDSTRDSIFTDENSFTDVAVDRWSNKAVSTMAKGGYVLGYEDNTFKPAANITRAEFVTIAARFYNVKADDAIENANYSDIDGHWAKTFINYAASKNWITGYEDGTFRPDRAITRAEAMKIINNLLNRDVNAEGLHADAKTWDDNASTAWYYYDVIEATNSHNYTRAEGETYEKWTEITENKVWTDKPEYEDAE